MKRKKEMKNTRKDGPDRLVLICLFMFFIVTFWTTLFVAVAGQSSRRRMRKTASKFPEEEEIEQMELEEEEADIDSPWSGFEFVHQDTMVVIVSKLDHFEARDAIRKSWLNMDNYKIDSSVKNEINSRFKVKFLVSRRSCSIPERFLVHPLTCDLDESKKLKDPREFQFASNLLAEKNAEIEAKIMEEENKNRDIISIPIVEAYRSLPEKMMSFFSGISEDDEDHFKYILKIDDDSIVHLDRLLNFMNSKLFLDDYRKHKYLQIGRMNYDSKVQRHGKWEELKYKPDVYPTFALGASGYLISVDYAKVISSQMGKQEYYQGEDTTIAIWGDELEKAGELADVKKVNRKDVFTQDKLCHSQRVITVGHDFKPQELMGCFMLSRR